MSDGEIICDFVDSLKWKKYDSEQLTGKVYDYIIEKNSLIEPNLGHFSIDDSTWNLGKDGEEINLNYWLKTDASSGKVKFVMHKSSIPFSVGSRDCAGQALAMKELYGFFANLVLNYEIFATDEIKKRTHIPIHTGMGNPTSQVEPKIAVIIRKRSS